MTNHSPSLVDKLQDTPKFTKYKNCLLKTVQPTLSLIHCRLYVSLKGIKVIKYIWEFINKIVCKGSLRVIEFA